MVTTSNEPNFKIIASDIYGHFMRVDRPPADSIKVDNIKHVNDNLYSAVVTLMVNCVGEKYSELKIRFALDSRNRVIEKSIYYPNFSNHHG